MNTKRGDVAIYLKGLVPVIRGNDISCLKESIVWKYIEYKCFFTSLYRPHSRSKDQFDESCQRFKMLTSNIYDENS